MPFDALPEALVTDMAKLRTALAGVRDRWATFNIGGPDGEAHCAIGWLLVATDWNRDEAVRLALDYVYPALPEKARSPERLKSIYNFNDCGSHRRIVRLFENAVMLAEQRAAH
jgi:hypothetical protein